MPKDQRTIAFDAKICGEKSNCKGWSLTGVYKVNTSVTGSSSLEIDAIVKSEKPIKKNSIFGLGWGIGYGPSDSFTETYVAMH